MTDRRVVQAVVYLIGTGLILCIFTLAAVMVLARHPDPVVFTSLSAVTTTLAGGLVGLLASTRSTQPTSTEESAAPPAEAAPFPG